MSDSVLKDLLKEYEIKRLHAEQLADEKRDQLFKKYSEFEEINSEIAKCGLNLSREKLQAHDNQKIDVLKQELELLKEKTKIQEAVKCGKCKINGEEVVLAVMDGNFLMGSMGSAVGERITLAIETAIKNQLPIIIFCVSGGARMQEGIISLMQMAKTSAAIAKLNEQGLLYISVLTDPTTGGVTASFASLGDIILAEPEALIGFAGPRVIEQTIGQKLPEGFQKSEFLLEHGFIDKIVERKDMKETISKIIKMHKKVS